MGPSIPVSPRTKQELENRKDGRTYDQVLREDFLGIRPEFEKGDSVYISSFDVTGKVQSVDEGNVRVQFDNEEGGVWAPENRLKKAADNLSRRRKCEKGERRKQVRRALERVPSNEYVTSEELADMEAPPGPDDWRFRTVSAILSKLYLDEGVTEREKRCEIDGYSGRGYVYRGLGEEE